MEQTKSFGQKIKDFITANPRKIKLIGIIAIALIVPLTVATALTVQILKQQAGAGITVVNFSDQGGNRLTSSQDPNVYIDIELKAAPGWALPDNKTSYEIVEKAYAQTYCSYPRFCMGFPGGSIPDDLDCTGYCQNIGTDPDDPTFEGQCCQKKEITPTPITVTCVKRYGFYGNGYKCCEGLVEDKDGTCQPEPSITPIPLSPTLTIDNPYTGRRGGGDINPPPSDIIQVSTTPNPTETSPSPSPTPSPIILKAIYIENKDTDESTGGSAPVKITVNSIADIAHIPWRLNDLLQGQNQASRIVQVTFIGDSETVTFASAINIIKPTQPTNALSKVELSLFRCSPQLITGEECQLSVLGYDTAGFPITENLTYKWGVSSSNSVGTLSKTEGNLATFYAKNAGVADVWIIAQQGDIQVQKSINFIVEVKISPSPRPNVSIFPTASPKVSPSPIPLTIDLNGDGFINCKDSEILIAQYGKKGSNLALDLNRDGLIDGIDYNMILRSYTPGDNVKCN